MLAYGFTGGDSASPHHGAGMQGLIAVAMLFAPWIAIAAIFRQRELERGALERRALDARLRLLQSQIEPHFLFNTLANVQALVETQSPQAPKVLASLIAYLRAAVPRMEEESSTLEREVELVRAYLELMQMRIPDRLQYALHVDPAALRLQCPPVTLLTLVENAVRHGIDPGETGGRIDVHVWVHSGRCNIEVIDTGLGLRSQNPGLGTGLSNLRERLQLTFGNDVELKLVGISPHGVSAALSFPARKEGA
jgi:LytS/YehU family sensor histidine kinase